MRSCNRTGDGSRDLNDPCDLKEPCCESIHHCNLAACINLFSSTPRCMLPLESPVYVPHYAMMPWQRGFAAQCRPHRIPSCGASAEEKMNSTRDLSPAHALPIEPAQHEDQTHDRARAVFTRMDANLSMKQKIHEATQDAQALLHPFPSLSIPSTLSTCSATD